jgi:hypothetical protein
VKTQALIRARNRRRAVVQVAKAETRQDCKTKQDNDPSEIYQKTVLKTKLKTAKTEVVSKSSPFPKFVQH